ncbi:hypothetical protein B0H13DRAFT_1922874 [Mycena leptocephala]|nr:hypothetical protein B0H13DRAFT_1922874 [Mycena leptocephala]
MEGDMSKSWKTPNDKRMKQWRDVPDLQPLSWAWTRKLCCIMACRVRAVGTQRDSWDRDNGTEDACRRWGGLVHTRRTTPKDKETHRYHVGRVLPHPESQRRHIDGREPVYIVKRQRYVQEFHAWNKGRRERQRTATRYASKFATVVIINPLK